MKKLSLSLSTHNNPFPLSFTLLLLHENPRRDILPPTICAAVGKHPVQLSLFDPQPSTVCSLLKMEGTQTTTREEGTTERNGDQGTSSNVPMSSKPLHRFVRKEPRSLGIVILMFGCAELLMGFQFSNEEFKFSAQLIPFWQGALFLTCGILSVYTELHPSKKMVTVCLALYVVSIFGIVISFIYRMIQVISYPYFFFLRFHLNDASVMLLESIEAILLISTISVLVILIFLTTVASFALKSTRTQVIVQQIPPPRTETPSD
uniref:Uncharacterized protein n=2 Tax=Astatotilapia calliptera TaxID=8154 RepID=A0A3P8P9G8_ASTCA